VRRAAGGGDRRAGPRQAAAAARRAAEGAARRGRQPAGRGQRGGGQRRPTGNRRLENVLPCTSESQMQLVVFQGNNDSGTGTSVEPPEAEPVRGDQGQQVEGPIIEDDEPMFVDETEASDGDNYDYSIEHDPKLRPPISSYAVNDRDSVRRAYIALGYVNQR